MDRSPAEEALIRRAAQIFGLAMGYIDYLSPATVLKPTPCQSLQYPLHLLHGKDDEVKAAYRKLSRQFHPDTLASQGMGEEFTAHATAKFREIQGAWETIKEQRSIR